jgi:hypothetical protein
MAKYIIKNSCIDAVQNKGNNLKEIMKLLNIDYIPGIFDDGSIRINISPWNCMPVPLNHWIILHFSNEGKNIFTMEDWIFNCVYEPIEGEDYGEKISDNSTDNGSPSD